MLSFPEVPETMLGLTKGGHSGRGLGSIREQAIFEELVANEDVQEHGITHLVEMQLLIDGIGFDMISDMCTNIAKTFLVNYTQQQCSLVGIPILPVVLNHVFDWNELNWDGIHVKLPINPVDNSPILLVPKLVVRRFEALGPQDFWHTIYRSVLMQIESERSLQSIGRSPKVADIEKKYPYKKQTVVRVLHERPQLLRSYLDLREKSSTPYEIDLYKVPGTDGSRTSPEDFEQLLHDVNPGRTDSKKYEKVILRLLTRLWHPHLINPEEQVFTEDGREIIDITFWNAADRGFWHDIKEKHGGTSVFFELKNKTQIDNSDVFQISARLNDVKGKLGFLVCRELRNADIERAYRQLYLDRKVVLLLEDKDLLAMMRGNPNELVQEKYRRFIEGA